MATLDGRPTMELRHLRYFVAVAEEKSFTRAAARLRMRQPPLSQQIKMLEREIGVRLFERLPKGVELTAGGVVFLADAQAALAGVERAAQKAVHAANGIEGALSVGLHQLRGVASRRARYHSPLQPQLSSRGTHVSRGQRGRSDRGDRARRPGRSGRARARGAAAQSALSHPIQ